VPKAGKQPLAPEAEEQPVLTRAGEQPVAPEAEERPVAPGGGQGSQRAAWGTISRSQIVEAAIVAIRTGREEQLTIRGLAATLGVAPMSLYHHVRSRDDLLDEVVGVLLGEVWRPESPEPTAPDEVRAWLAEAADRFRRFLVAHAVALHVYLRQPVTSETAIARMEAMLRVLAAAGLAGEEAHRAYGALHTYTIGFAALEASRRRAVPPAGRRSPEELASRLAAYTTEEQFRTGLDLLLDGVIGRASGGGDVGRASRGGDVGRASRGAAAGEGETS